MTTSTADAAATAKAAMEACKESVGILNAMVKSNQAILETYNKEHQKWITTNNAANKIWEQNDSTNRGKQKDWDDRRDANYNAKKSEIKDGDCGFAINVPMCPDVWGEVSRHACKFNCVNFGFLGTACTDGMYKKCQKSDDASMREATVLTVSQLGNRPANYNVARYSAINKEPQQQDYKQNESNVDVKCCSNVANIVGSDVTDSVIKQQNDCMSDLTKKATDAATADALAKAKIKDDADAKAKADADAKAKADAATTAATTAAPATTAAATTAATPAPATAATVTATPATEQSNSNVMMMMMLLIICLILLCSSSSIGFYLYSSSE